MTKKAKPDILKNVKRDEFRKFLARGDGHGIYPASYFTDQVGLPAEFVKKFNVVHKSDGSWKGTITDKEGRDVKSLKGVHGLPIVRALAYELGADTQEADTKMGRGFAAQCYCQAIVDKLGESWFGEKKTA